MTMTRSLFVLAVLLVAGSGVLLAAQSEDTVTLTGELETVATDSGEDYSGAIYDEEWGPVLLSAGEDARSIFEQAGRRLEVTGAIRPAEKQSDYSHVLQVERFRIVSLTGTESGNQVAARSAPRARTRPDIPPGLVTGPRGEVISLIGRNDIGLDELSSRQPERIAESLRAFTLRNREKFKFAASDDVRLGVKLVEPLDVGLRVATIHQYVGQLRVLDSDVSAVIGDDGTLESLNGKLVPLRSPEIRAVSNINRVVETLRRDAQGRGILAAVGDLWTFEPVAPNRWLRRDGATIEAGWSAIRQAPVWRASLPVEVIWVDDRSGKILMRESHNDEWNDSVTGACFVGHRNWPRGADRRATSLNETTKSVIIERVTCGGDDWYGTCNWHLKRQPRGFQHGIARIRDVNGGEQERSLPCGSTRIPKFTNTNGDALREQGAFYVINQMRHFINQNVWSQVRPNRQSNVDVHMDDPGVETAIFNNFWTSIRVSPSFGRQEILMHEYGHYVVWTYDDVSNNCIPGSDEGDSIDETLANVFGALYALDDPEINPVYGALQGFANRTGPSAHVGENSLITQNVSCRFKSNPFDGQAFQQAVWELMFNHNCSASTCAFSSGPGNAIWVGESQERVIMHVGAALGFALRVLGRNITHSQIRAQMIVKIAIDSGSETAGRALAVFRHHGI